MFYSAMTDLLIDLLTKFFKKNCIFEEQLYNLKLQKPEPIIFLNCSKAESIKPTELINTGTKYKILIYLRYSYLMNMIDYSSLFQVLFN